MKQRFENILVGLIFAVFSLVIIILIFRFTGLANVFLTWSILMLAAAVFLTIHHSREQERHRREGEKLKEIMDWVDGILKYCAVYSQNPVADDRYSLAAVIELKLNIDYVMSIADNFGEALVEPLKRVTELFAMNFNKLEEDMEREKLEGLCTEAKIAISLLRGK